MLPRKTGKPIAFKCTEEFRNQTEAIADSLGESLSDYTRKAVETRNNQYAQYKPTEAETVKAYEKIRPAKQHKDYIHSKAKEYLETANKEKSVQTFFKK